MSDPAPMPAPAAFPALFDFDEPVIDEEIERLIGRRLADEYKAVELAEVRSAIRRGPGPSLAPDDLEGSTPWRITNDGLADWAMARLATAEQQITHIQAQRDEYVARADALYERMVRQPVKDKAFFTAHLEDYAIRRREETGDKVKTVELPSGSISTRRGSPAPTIADTDEVLEWAQDWELDVVETTSKVRWKDLKPLLAVRKIKFRDEDDGEEYEGLAVVSALPNDAGEITYGTTPVPGLAIDFPTTTATVHPAPPITPPTD